PGQTGRTVGRIRRNTKDDRGGAGSTTHGRPERPHLLIGRCAAACQRTGEDFCLMEGPDSGYLYGKGEFDGIATRCHRGRTRLGVTRSPTQPARSDRKRRPWCPQGRTVRQTPRDAGKGEKRMKRSLRRLLTASAICLGAGIVLAGTPL